MRLDTRQRSPSTIVELQIKFLFSVNDNRINTASSTNTDAVYQALFNYYGQL